MPCYHARKYLGPITNKYQRLRTEPRSGFRAQFHYHRPPAMLYWMEEVSEVRGARVAGTVCHQSCSTSWTMRRKQPAEAAEAQRKLHVPMEPQ